MRKKKQNKWSKVFQWVLIGWWFYELLKNYSNYFEGNTFWSFLLEITKSFKVCK